MAGKRSTNSKTKITMNITDESEGYYLLSLQQKIDRVIERFNKTKLEDKEERKKLREKYKKLITEYKTFTKQDVYKKELK